MPKQSLRAVVTVVLAAALGSLAGCGKGGPEGTLPVSGTIAVAGKPLTKGAVHFVQEGGTGTVMARVTAGKFSTHLRPTAYAIAVTGDAQPESFDEKTGKLIPPQRLVPEKYMAADKSGLTATIDSAHRTVALDLAPYRLLGAAIVVKMMTPRL
jgi:hypothetical protein